MTDTYPRETISATEAVISAPYDVEDDIRDGILFRLWCQAASYPGGSPSTLHKMFDKHQPKTGNVRPAHYRAALLEYAQIMGVNLP